VANNENPSLFAYVYKPAFDFYSIVGLLLFLSQNQQRKAEDLTIVPLETQKKKRTKSPFRPVIMAYIDICPRKPAAMRVFSLEKGG